LAPDRKKSQPYGTNPEKLAAKAMSIFCPDRCRYDEKTSGAKPAKKNTKYKA